MKILYVTTISDTMGFFPEHIRMLLEQGNTVDMACNIVSPVRQRLLDWGCKVHNIGFERSPLNKGNCQAYKSLKKLIVDEEYDLVHTHTPVASVIVRLVCKNLENVKVIYTAHGFHFFKGAAFVNWLVYYPIEKWLSRYTDVLITINKEDYERAKGFKAKRVEYVPGVGIDVDKFNSVEMNKELKRKELNLSQDAFVVLSVGELNKNKNHEVVIRAIAKTNNPKIHYIICGQGGLKEYLQDLSGELGIERQVHLLGFRKDIAEICKASDMFAFPSFREGLPVSLMEAMACGLPVVCSRIRGSLDLIEDGKSGYLVEPTDIDAFAKNIEEILYDSTLRNQLGRFNVKQIKSYSMDNILMVMKKIYSK